MRAPPIPLPSLALALVLSACAGASDAAPAPPPSPAPSPASETPPASGPSLPPPGTTVTAPACGYGGSAPAVSVFVDVTTSTPLTGVTLSFTLADPSTGTPVGRSAAPESLLVSPVERGLLDFSIQGTQAFDGTIPAATPTRLQYFAGLGEDPAHPIAPSAIGGPLRVDVTVHANEGTFTASCATAGMWPSS